MAEIVIKNHTSNIWNISEDLKSYIKSILSYKVKGCEWTQAYRRGKWDGRKYLFWRGNAFPTGLSGMVYNACSSLGLEPIITDKRVRPDHGPGIKFLGEDRDYQRIEDICIDATRGVINFSMGAGKTAIASRIISKIDLPTLYVVPTVELLYQTKTALEGFLGVPVGIVGDNKFQSEEYIVVATIQTLWAVLKPRDESKPPHKNLELTQHILDSRDLLFIDEAHHLGAESFYGVAMKSNAYYKFGMTGTAFRSDDSTILLRAATGKIISQITTSELIDKGVLSKTFVRLYEIKTKRSLGRNWQDIYWNGIVKNEVRNNLIISEAKKFLDDNKTVLIIVKFLEHGRILTDAIPGAEFVSGSVDTDIRKSVRERFSRKELLCLVATKIYDEGVDIPVIDALIMASGGLSPIKVLQRVGRVLRKSEGKEHTVVVDFNDAFHKTLKRHSKARLKLYQTEPAYQIESVKGEEVNSAI